MARLEWVLVVQLASLDRQTNNLTLTNVIEELTVPATAIEPPTGKVVAIHPAFTVVMRWIRDDLKVPEKTSARLRIFSPSRRKPLGNGDIVVDMTGQILRTRAMVQFPFFPYAGPGEYRIDVQQKIEGRTESWRKAGATSIFVRREGPDTPASSA